MVIVIVGRTYVRAVPMGGVARGCGRTSSTPWRFPPGTGVGTSAGGCQPNTYQIGPNPNGESVDEVPSRDRGSYQRWRWRRWASA
ncbi:hypothetical protein K438DRAFT_769983 [Mycena galopus ATCC 62051]|nr:hypothetical protein K438DRAFT_769983 [Mycena galopus ATCC 62051]